MKMDVRFRHVFLTGTFGALCALVGVAFGIGHMASALAAQVSPGGNATLPADTFAYYPLGECPQNVVLGAHETRLFTCSFVAPVNIGSADFVMASVSSGAFDRIRAWLADAGPTGTVPTRTVTVYFFAENLMDHSAVATPSATAVLFHVPQRGELEKETPAGGTAGVDYGN